MQLFDFNKVLQTGVVALVLGGSTLMSPTTAVAADLPPYFSDQETVLERPPVRRRLAVEETYIAQPIEQKVIERRVIERRFVDGFEGPALVPQQHLPIVSVEESEGYEGPALVPPQEVPIVSVQRDVPSRVYQQGGVDIPGAVEECRVVVTKQISPYGDVTMRRTRICD